MISLSSYLIQKSLNDMGKSFAFIFDQILL